MVQSPANKVGEVPDPCIQAQRVTQTGITRASSHQETAEWIFSASAFAPSSLPKPHSPLPPSCKDVVSNRSWKTLAQLPGVVRPSQSVFIHLQLAKGVQARNAVIGCKIQYQFDQLLQRSEIGDVFATSVALAGQDCDKGHSQMQNRGLLILLHKHCTKWFCIRKYI